MGILYVLIGLIVLLGVAGIVGWAMLNRNLSKTPKRENKSAKAPAKRADKREIQFIKEGKAVTLEMDEYTYRTIHLLMDDPKTSYLASKMLEGMVK